MGWQRNAVFLLALGILGLQGCQSSPPKTDVPMAWPEKMQNVSDDVGELVPFIYNRREFLNPKNTKAIGQRINRFAKSAHKVPVEAAEKILGKDPIARYSINNLQRDVESAQKVFSEGHYEYARTLLRSSVSHCFRCHTRTEFGPELTQWKFDFSRLALTPTEKADLYVATRQYDKALEGLSEVLRDEAHFYDNPYELEGVIKRYMALMVRVRKDPMVTLGTITKFLQRDNVPIYLQENARKWKKSLENWQKESPTQKSSLAEARRLVNRARKMQEYEADEASNVEYLRASSILHDLVLQAPSGRERAETYFLLGRCYNALADFNFWGVPELYFEACIRELPGSPLAWQCFVDYEQNVILGFSGSAGVLIPSVERERIDALKKIAKGK